MFDQELFIWLIFSTWQADNHRQMFRLSDSKMNLEFPSGQPLVSSPDLSGLKYDNCQYFNQIGSPSSHIYFFYMRGMNLHLGNCISGYTWIICIISWNIIKSGRSVSYRTAKNNETGDMSSQLSVLITENNDNEAAYTLSLTSTGGSTHSDVVKLLFIHRMFPSINLCPKCSQISLVPFQKFISLYQHEKGKQGVDPTHKAIILYQQFGARPISPVNKEIVILGDGLPPVLLDSNPNANHFIRENLSKILCSGHTV